MNKEIEYLLNEMKDATQDYIGTNGCKYQDLLREELDLLLSYIEQLENLCNKYEQEHKTTFEIWKKDIKKLEQLENNRDKAIEYNEHLIEHAKYHLNLGHLKKMRKILKGDSDE